MRHQDYTVGWICALPTEMAAAKAMLDEVHSPLKQDPDDHNTYVLGRIGVHNVVLACLPSGVTGTVSAATVAMQMLITFKSLRIKLMVGIGGGVPSVGNDIRLGDIVVSHPVGTYGGVVQYDFGKTIQKGQFTLTGYLNKPPRELLSTLSVLRTNHKLKGYEVLHHLANMSNAYPGAEAEFKFPGVQNDWLYEAEYDHPLENATCSQCDGSRLVNRKSRSSASPVIHYGLIASGDRVMRDGSMRERLRKELDVLCFEMEAAGLMDSFPCLVIRGICDYADSHKNKVWQGYAAATAAAYTKELLLLIPELQAAEKENNSVKAQQDLSDTETKCLQCLYPGDYESYRKRNPDRVPGTCEWFLQHSKYQNWLKEQKSSLLWVSADPGCGKSVLASFLVGELKGSKSQTLLPGIVSFFFFKDDNDKQGNAILAIRALLHQICRTEKSPLGHATEEFKHKGENFAEEFGTLWDILMSVAGNPGCGNVICLLDGLDECEESTRIQLTDSLLRFYSSDEGQNRDGAFLKFIITSRPHHTIETRFRKLPTIRFKVEEETDKTVDDINLFIKAMMSDLEETKSLPERIRIRLENKLVKGADRTFLWVSLILQILGEMADGSEKRFEEVCDNLPPDLDSIYEKILRQSSDSNKAKIILQIITAASRPLTLEEMNIALAIQPHHRSMKDLKPDLAFSIESALKRFCGPFIRIIDSKIYLVHQTAKNFLTKPAMTPPSDQNSSPRFWKHSIDPTKSNHILVEKCVWYLLLSDFENNFPVLSPTDTQRYTQIYTYTKEYKFLDYAAENWNTHITNAKIQEEAALWKLILDLYDTKSKKFITWWHTYCAWTHFVLRDITALNIASYFGHNAIIKCLLDNGVDIESKDWIGRTALWWATDMGHEQVVKLLLDNGVDMDSKDKDWQTALIHAAKKGHEQVVKLLLDNGSDMGSKDREGRTALMWAAKMGHERVVKLLLDNGSDMGSKEREGRTALMWAAKERHEQVVKLLLDNGADMEAKDEEGKTALMWATRPGYKAIIKLLLENGVGSEAKDVVGRTALSYAVVEGRPSIIELLLDGGAAIDSEDRYGRTPLSWAVSFGDKTVTDLLLRRGANIESKDKWGRTPLSMVRWRGTVAMAQLLLRNGAEVDSKDSFGRTPLSRAAQDGNKAVVELLLRSGANIDSEDDNGGTALSWAKLGGEESVVELLQSWPRQLVPANQT